MKVKDPEQPSKIVQQLYVLCRGPRTDGKYETLNIALIWLSKFMIYKSYIGVDLSDINVFIKAQLQPNTVATSFRMLFSWFSEECVTFSLAKHFNRIGTFFLSYRIFSVGRHSIFRIFHSHFMSLLI